MGNADNTLTSPSGARGVIPTSQVIVLKEQELDCDLGTAIRRIRECEETSNSRILVVAPDEPEASAEPPRSPVIAPTTLGQVARRAHQAATERLGAELTPAATGMQHFVSEVRSALDGWSEEESGATAREAIRQIVDWMEVTAEDMVQRTSRASCGFLLVDTHELLVDMATQVEAAYPGIRVSIGPSAGVSCPARPAELAEGLFLALSLVAQRIGGKGGITVELEEATDGLAHRIAGHGEPRSVSDGEAIARFRSLIVDLHGGVVHQDGLGAEGAGLTIRLPAAI